MRQLVCITLLVLCPTHELLSQAAPEPRDLVRIAEAVRLAGILKAEVWPGWESTPFPILLVDTDREFLIGTSDRPSGFSRSGYSVLLRDEIWSRPRQFDPGLLATFPAFGPPAVVVIGRAEATDKKSVPWVLSLLHEHFHQYQMSAPGYYAEVEGLGLSDGDETGRWMLDYPFPYDSPKVTSAFAAVSRELGRTLGGSASQDRQKFWSAYTGFLRMLSDRDRRYLGFQLWQEGVARYVELTVAELAARAEGSIEFRRLPDAEPFARAAQRMRATIATDLASPDLSVRKRLSFYAFGAGLALLLDRDGDRWKRRYMKQKFRLEPYPVDTLEVRP